MAPVASLTLFCSCDSDGRKMGQVHYFEDWDALERTFPFFSLEGLSVLVVEQVVIPMCLLASEWEDGHRSGLIDEALGHDYVVDI